MRSLRWLLLVAIAVIAVAVIGIYRDQRRAARAHRRAVPAALPKGTVGNAEDFKWAQSRPNGTPDFELSAKESRQLDNNTNELKEIELHIYDRKGEKFNRVKSPEAQFSPTEKKLYAPGEAEITLDVPVGGDNGHALTSIRAAGINFNSESGQAVTDKPVSFTFEGGDGTCTGASYDPDKHELHLEHDVVVNLRGKDGKAKPMKVEAGELTYSETDSLIHLGPWSRMTSAEAVMNAGASTVKLSADKKIDTIDAANAGGIDRRPGRELDYSAGMLHVQYDSNGNMEKLNGAGNAKLVSHGKGSDTTMTGNNVDLFFDTGSGESELSTAVARGDGTIESKPTPDPKGNTPDTKIMKADTLDLHMKPGGKDLDRVNTQAPGTLEFLPSQATRHRRVLKANQMDVAYGVNNEIKSFHAVDASTETYASDDDRKRKRNLDTAFTSSKVIDAGFDAKGELSEMKQTDNFRYTAGVRKAQSDVATLEHESNVMNLEAHARISDDTGSTAADHIQLDEATGDFDARGHVATTRLPDQKKNASDMLDQDEPTQGMADRVTSADRNSRIHYAGNAVLWQSSNRLQADKIDIDRGKKQVTADDKVVSQFQDDAKKKPVGAQPVFTIVKARHMVYTDPDRQAVYTGGANMWRPSLTVKSSVIKAFLNDNKSNSDSRLNHAFADGKVEIVDDVPKRKRVGTSEHAEYYANDNKIILTGGKPLLTDTQGTDTTGDTLTYFTDDERLLINGTPKKPVETHRRNKSK